MSVNYIKYLHSCLGYLCQKVRKRQNLSLKACLTLAKDAAKDVSKRILFALSILSEHASLLQTLGEHLNFTQLNLRESLIDNSGAASLSQALAVNSSLTSLNLSTTLIGVSGAVLYRCTYVLSCKHVL